MGRKIVIASTGTETLICIDGKVYGEHVERIEFSHTGGLIAEIRLSVNDMPAEGEAVGDGFRNFINSLLDTASKEAREQRIEAAFKKGNI